MIEEKPFTEQLKSKQWLTDGINEINKYSKMQEAFKEIAKYIKSMRNRFNETKLVFYDEIETLRIKFERGKDAAKKYQERWKYINEEFQRIFIEKNINFKRDLDSSWVREFIETRHLRKKNISFAEPSLEMSAQADGMSRKTKALYLCIKKQMSRENHPISKINKKFAEVFCLCYKQFVDRSRTTTDKLKKRLDYLNLRMLSMSKGEEIIVPRPGLERSESELSPKFREQPNYLLTQQVVGDIKIFIKIIISMTCNYYLPVIMESELQDMKEDLVETVTNLILSKEVYRIVFSFFRLEFTQLEKNLKDRFKEYRKITPGEWRVNEYFRCDASSPILKIYQDIVKKDMKSMFSEPMSINFEPPHRYSTSNRGIVRSRSFVEEHKGSFEDEEEEKEKHEPTYYEDCDKLSGWEVSKRRSKSFEYIDGLPYNDQIAKLPKFKDIQGRLQTKPFHQAIIKLRELDDREGPMMKVRLLEQVNWMIKDNISKFWEGIPVDESHLTITQDTKIPLYIYVVLKSKLVNLPAHIKFIQEFTTRYIHENNLGSNLALYESAMTIVADKQRNTLANVIDFQELLKRTTANNESFVSSVFNDDTDPFYEFTIREDQSDYLARS